MRIGIFGSGSMGSALASVLTRAGFQVRISSRNKTAVKNVARESGAGAASNAAGMVEWAEAIVLSIPYLAVSELLDTLDHGIAGKVLVDATNPLSADLSTLVTNDVSGAEQIQQRLPTVSVIKAFNTVLANRLRTAHIDHEVLDGFVAGDDPKSKDEVLRMVSRVGLNPIDVGPLSMARSLEGMALLNIGVNLRNGGSWRTGWKLSDASGQALRATAVSAP